MKNVYGCFVLLLAGLATSTSQDGPTVKVNGVELKERAIVRNGVSYAPLNAIAASLGGSATLERNVITVEIPGFIASPGNFWDDEGAWTKAEAEQWFKDARSWIEKTDPYVSLVDVNRITYSSARETEVRRNTLELSKRSFARLRTAIEGIHTVIERDYPIDSWTSLSLMEAMASALDESLGLDSKLRTAYSSSDPPAGLPSIELLIRISEQTSVGLDLQYRLIPHLTAIEHWYDRYPAPVVPQ